MLKKIAYQSVIGWYQKQGKTQEKYHAEIAESRYVPMVCCLVFLWFLI